MHAAKLVLNATVMGGLNLAAFVIGFWIFQISASGEQRLVQGTAAVVVGIGFMNYSRRVKPEPVAVFFAVFSICYPVFAVISIRTVGPLPVVVILCAVLLLRTIVPTMRRKLGLLTWGLLVVVLGVAGIAAFDAELSVRLYPVLINAAMFVSFAVTLVHPPSMIEMFTRFSEPDLPPSGVAYTRKVTIVWMGFFALNGLIALFTVIAGSWTVWMVYNGAISYVAAGCLFLVEFLVRQRARGAEAEA